MLSRKYIKCRNKARLGKNQYIYIWLHFVAFFIFKMTCILDINYCPLNKTTRKCSKSFPTLRSLWYHIRHGHKDERIPVFSIGGRFLQKHNKVTEHHIKEILLSFNQMVVLLYLKQLIIKCKNPQIIILLRDGIEWWEIYERICTHEIFYKWECPGYTVILYDIDVQEYGYIDMFFTVLYKVKILDLCFAQ